MVTPLLLEDGIAAAEHQALPFHVHGHVHEGRVTGVHSVLESVLHQGDEQQRSHFHALLRHFQVLFHRGELIAAQGHEVYVIAHEIQLRRQRDLGCLAIV